MTTGEEMKRRKEEVEEARVIFQEALDIDEDFANLLVTEGFISLDDLAYCPLEEITGIEGLDEELSAELQNRARNALLNRALSQNEAAEGGVSLLELKGMTTEIAEQLAARGIVSVEMLADAAADDLDGIVGLSREQAEALIITAREASGWFDD